MKLANGVGNAIQLTNTVFNKGLFSWSSDNKYISYTQTNPKTKADMYYLRVSESMDTINSKPKVFLNSEFQEFGGYFSPDGKWLTYASDESGKFQVYVRPFPGPGSKWQISTLPPSFGYFGWATSGKEIYYRSESNKIMSVEVNPHGNVFEVGKANVLFDIPFSGQAIFEGVTKDNKHFLFRVPVQTSEIAPLTIVTNWNKKLIKKE